MQTILVKQYLASLGKKLDTKISVGEIDVSLFDKLIIRDLYIEDLHEDTLLYAKCLELDVAMFSYKEKKVVVDKMELTNTFFNLQKEKNEVKNNLAFIIEHFATVDTTKSDWSFAINDVILNKAKFQYNDYNLEKKKSGVDYDHVSISHLDLSLSNIKLVDRGIDCKVNRLNFFEKSGFQVDKFTTLLNLTSSGIVTKDLRIETPYSNVDGDVAFLTKDYSDLSNFIKDVQIESIFNTTKIDFRDISFFAPTLNQLNKSLNLKGTISGTIDNLKGRELAIVIDDGTRFKGDADISGLPSSVDMFMHVKVKELLTSKQKLESIPLYPFVKEKFIKLPDNFRHLGVIKFEGNFTGFYHDFVAYGNIQTSLGNLVTDVSLKLKNGVSYYKGDVISDHFNLGKFVEMRNDLGDVSMNMNIDGKGFSKEDIDATLTGAIEQIIVKDYEYNNVAVKGRFENQVFEGFLAVEDENISFDFNGSIDLSKDLPEINFVSNIENAKLAKLNFIKSNKALKTRFSTQLKVNLLGKSADDLVGEIEFVNSRYNDKLDSISVDNILIESSNIDSLRTISIKSDLLDAQMNGKFKFKEIGNYAKNFLNRYIPSQIDERHEVVDLSDNVTFNIEFHNSELVSKLLFNGVKMSEHTSLKGNYDSQKHILTVNADAPFIDLYGVKIMDLSFTAGADEKILDLALDVDKIYQNDSLYIDNFNVVNKTVNDSVLTELTWKNNETSAKNVGHILISSWFNGFDKISNRFINSYAYISDTLWSVNDGNEIIIDTGSLVVKDLAVYSKNQRVLIDGCLSEGVGNQLDVELNSFDLLTFKKIIPENIISLEGVVNGVASVRKERSELIFTSDLSFTKFKINQHLIGVGEVKSAWNSSDEVLKMNGRFYDNSERSILFGGYYYPNKEEEKLDLELTLNQTKLSIFDKYTESFLSNFKGLANAKIGLTGNFKEPKLNGYIALSGTEFTVKYLNTHYSTNYCRINLASDMISFDNVEFLDKNDHKATAIATVYHEWFSDWSLDVGLFIDDQDGFLALNTTEKDNSVYYGKAYVAGVVDIEGSGKNMNIDVNVKTKKNTVLNIPLSNSEELVENNFIEFVQREDSMGIELDKQEHVDLSNIEMKFDLEITPEAQLRLIFDDQIGDVMRSTGSGNINLQINKDRDLDIYGNYIVKDGDYLFTLQNVINKRFDLEEGGTISWSGDPYDAEINLTAVYRLRARLYDLLATIDTNEIYKKRIPVDLKLKMTNAMMNPDINFDIYLPSADEDTRSKVRSVLYVSDKEENIQELNKQVFSLLVLNSFLPPPGIGSSYERASVGSTTSSELLSNQLSNMVSKISNDFDLGFNYTPGDELSNREYELAFSTQFFNDRLILDGNLGYSDRQDVSNQAQNTNNLIGDMSIEYKITKDGKLRIKAFNNSNQFSLENVNSPYTQGVGLSYKEEYNTNKEFWQKLFSRFEGKGKKAKK